LTRAIIGAVFVFALGFYLLAWPDAPIIEGDSPQYLQVSQDLEDFKLDALHDRAPGYPMLLVLTGSSRGPGRTLLVVSLLLHFVSIAVLAGVLRACDLPRSWILVFCCLLLLPPYVEPAAHVMTENLAQFALVSALGCIVAWFVQGRRWLLAAASVFIGFAALTRPTYQALAVVLGAGFLVCPAALRPPGCTRSRIVKAAVPLCAGTMLMLGLVSWANYRNLGYFGVVPTAGIHLSTKTMAFVERLPDEYGAVREILIRERDAQLTKRGGTHSGTQTIWTARSQIAAVTGLSQAQLSSYLVRMNLTLIRRAAVEYLEEVARSLAVYWFPPAGAQAAMHSPVLRWVWALLHVAVVLALFCQLVVLTGVGLLRASASVAGLVTAGAGVQLTATRTQMFAYAVTAAIVFYTMFLSCLLDIGEVRQRRPTDVLLLLMVFVAGHVWAQSLRAANPPTPLDR
jgi:hypothetical protein